MFEQEHLRFINMFAATGNGGSGGVGHKFPTGIMEHKVIQNPEPRGRQVPLQAVAPTFHHSTRASWRFTRGDSAPIGQKIDLGKEMGKL